MTFDAKRAAARGDLAHASAIVKMTTEDGLKVADSLIISDSSGASEDSNKDAGKNGGPYTRERLNAVILVILAALGIVVNIAIAGPFIPGLTWALAFAVVADPLYRRISERVKRPGLASGLSVAAVALAIVIPAVFIGWQLGRQAASSAQMVQEQIKSGELKRQLERSPRMAAAWRWVESNVDVEKGIESAAETLQRKAGQWVMTAGWGIVQIFVALFALFYFFRDRTEVLLFLRSMMPMADSEAGYVLDRVRAIAHATIYGTLVVASIQGALGGLIFWILRIPGALLWAVAMGLLSIIPTLGAFIIWAPAAIYLAAQGEWMKAIVLTVWGTVVIGLIDNLLYPMLVGNEMRLHTLPVFIAIVGGLFLFGAAGLVLGPVILAATISVIDILRRRTMQGRSAEEPV